MKQVENNDQEMNVYVSARKQINKVFKKLSKKQCLRIKMRGNLIWELMAHALQEACVLGRAFSGSPLRGSRFKINPFPQNSCD